MEIEKARMEEGTFDEDNVWTLVEFISVVGDELHHGKEEAILFPTIKGRARSFEFDDIITTLMKEHAAIRHHLRILRNALEGYVQGDGETVGIVSREFGEVADLYSKHIKKEDGLFFPSAMSVLTKEEKERMTEAIMEFDRSFVIKRYEKLIDIALTDLTKS